MNFSVVFLKTLKEAKLQISTSILFHTIITTWDVLKKLLFSLKKGIWLFWTLQKVAVQKVSFSGTSCKNYAGDSSLIILQNRHNFLSQQLYFRVSRCSAWESFSDDVSLIAPVITTSRLYWRNLRPWWRVSLEGRSKTTSP